MAIKLKASAKKVANKFWYKDESFVDTKETLGIKDVAVAAPNAGAPKFIVANVIVHFENGLTLPCTLCESKQESAFLRGPQRAFKRANSENTEYTEIVRIPVAMKAVIMKELEPMLDFDAADEEAEDIADDDNKELEELE